MCPDYVGFFCVNGCCPNIDSPFHISCDDCGFNNQCSDCALFDTVYCGGFYERTQFFSS